MWLRIMMHLDFVCTSCVCVCVRERERERECVYLCVRVFECVRAAGVGGLVFDGMCV